MILKYRTLSGFLYGERYPWRVLVWDGDPGEENYIFDIWVPKDGVVTCCHWGILLSFLYILDHRLVFGYIS